MKKCFASPSKYIQGEGILPELGAYVKESGVKGFLVALREDRERIAESLDEAEKRADMRFVNGCFTGRCTSAELQRLSLLCVESKCDVVIGLGGGRALDAAKAASHSLRLPVIIVPTIASTDAPCSSVSVLYKENGELDRYLQLERPPSVVLADTGIIARAPVRFLVAGMGDALSTFFEARANARAAALRGRPGPSLAAMAIAEQCSRVLLKYSAEAKAACEARKVTEALEHIVEANLLLSGLGFEGSGLAAAHAIHNGLTMLEETRGCLHGEIVAFGVLVQLLLEKAPPEEIGEVLAYCRSVGLPVRLGELGLQEAGRERLLIAARAACSPDGPMVNMPFPVSPEEAVEAILAADRLSQQKEE
jgi:glycerol dehydrogenase